MSPNVIADSRNAASSTEHVSIGGQRLRVAIVHDWLNVVGGAERVLEQILALFPGADIFTLTDTLPATERGFLGKSRVQVSMIGKTPWLRHRHKLALPLMPAAIEAFDLSGYDLVLSSSFAVAKGVITRPDALHVCYCHSPMRYIWDLEHTYRRDAGLDRGIRSVLASFLFNHLRMWDVASASRPQVLMANSNFTASRIARYWGRDAQLLPPPVDLSRFSLQTAKGSDYLTVSRLVPYKRHDLMVQAFADLPERRLLIIGDGPQRAALEKIATPNVVFLGALPDREVAQHMRSARAFLFAAHEDFGIVPVEAQACGTPVIAYGVGGVRDTVRSWPAAQPTGLFFDQQTAESLREAILRFETIEHGFDPQVLRDNAERFSNERFRARFGGIIEQALAQRGTPDTAQAPADHWVSPAIAPSSQPPGVRKSVTKSYGGGETYSDIEIAGAM
jgi:glycosyltransferase involved in cell wall biosynthesis